MKINAETCPELAFAMVQRSIGLMSLLEIIEFLRENVRDGKVALPEVFPDLIEAKGLIGGLIKDNLKFLEVLMSKNGEKVVGKVPETVD